MSKCIQNDHLLMSKAVREWYRYYEVEWDDQASSFLCDAAIEFYNEGCRSVEEMATLLIGTYVGLAATRVNAPSSSSVH
ncbi:hypothetical protein ELI54_30075 (plasmid) [Rhizobium ruizarguesonis]|jgi:hypothetical protein|uniref:hypothetical protein n=1 Tax=Rhizobium ruizarguesonis TaxID=2081791 RepID=UPI001030A248|nr:hypothetical protein [Rhizobium ruizarguesonis]TAT72159.1 hypothetical protein ELI56_31285 [Rhizobium ruizarguesonis]TAT75809.1 hypothetical protein ELI54_30075 [Rhizobium ruizarguesonis]TAZ67731.1 hypothetical protein ELH70_29620 [Rhizobium ruizarguesonis]TAZ71111.1 hypothetical protein ELH72_29755 [Rhizobium ruizarguesonis]TAZ89059.1 hypothetical protein ELH69_33875 [Rhizobium ruizarguesonis]